MKSVTDFKIRKFNENLEERKTQSHHNQGDASCKSADIPSEIEESELNLDQDSENGKDIEDIQTSIEIDMDNQ